MKNLYKLFVILFTLSIIINAQNNKNVRKYRIDGVSKSEEIISKKFHLIKPNKKLNGTNGVNASPYLPLESFEDPFFPPAGWKLFTFDWVQIPGFSNTGSNSIAIFGEPFIESGLIPPPIDLSTTTGP